MTPVSDDIARITFALTIASWFGFGLVFLLRKKPPKAEESKRDPASRWGIALQSVGFFLTWFFQRLHFTPVIPMPIAAEYVVAVLTVGMALASDVLCLRAVQTLGKQWTYAARVIEGHELITQGPYAIVRNPIYLAMFGLMVSTGLASTKWPAILAGVIVFLIGNQIRIRSEERLLREVFGAQFDEYARRVPAFFPRIL
jgi:protein-S-isoprenylcysteine O-methyltransferase Ste14